jgi:hypothetical protein
LVSWKCQKGHVYKSQIDNRALKHSGCPFCSGRKAITGVNDLASVNLRLSEEAFGWDPRLIKPKSGKKYLWRCTKNHLYRATAASRTRGSGCPTCANRNIEIGFNDLKTTHPELAREAFKWDASKIVAGTGAKKQWKCSRGHVWVASVNSRTTSGVGCPVCSGNKVLPGFNDFKTLFPTVANEALGWNPSKFGYGSNSKKRWKCGKNHVWEAVIKSRASGRGCPTCAPYGFDPNKAAYVYLIEHKGKKLLKIGISNSSINRTKQHLSRGWDLIELFGPMPGSKAYDLEQGCLEFVLKNGGKQASLIEHGKFDGYTESWVTKTFPIESAKLMLKNLGLLR